MIELRSRHGNQSGRGVRLVTLLGTAAAPVADPSPGQLRNLRRLDELRQRLAIERFQLAVLGQFKRGKRPLLNALLGAPILPTAVVPLTAIPTFVEAGVVPRVRSIFASGATEEVIAEHAEGLAVHLHGSLPKRPIRTTYWDWRVSRYYSRCRCPNVAWC